MKNILPRFRLGPSLAALTVVLTVGFTLAMVEFVGDMATRQIRTDIGNTLKELAYQTTDKLDRGMFERYREVQLMAERDELSDPELSTVGKRSLLERMQRTYPEYAWIGLAGNDGKVQVATGGILEGADVSARPWFGNAYRGVHLSDVHQAVLLAKYLPNPGSEPKRFFDVAFPYEDAQGKVAGVLGVHLSWLWAKEIEQSVLSPLEKRKSVDAIITDKDGIVLLGADDLKDARLSVDSVQAAARGRSGFVTERWPDGRRYLVGYSKSIGYRDYPGFGWTVLVRQDVDEAYAPVYRMQRMLLLGGLAASVVFSLLMLVAIGRLTKPLRRIAGAAQEIEAGTADAMPRLPGSFHEIEALSGALNSLLGKLALKEQQQRELNATLEIRVEQRTRELSRERTLLNAVLETIDVGVVACDDRGELTLFNRTAREFHGLPPQAMQPGDWAAAYGLFCADGISRLRPEEVPLYRALQGEVVSNAEMMIIPDCLPPRFLLAGGRALVSAEGERMGAVVAMKDVTQLKESERQRAFNETRLRAIADNLPALIGHVDSRENFLFLNNRGAALFGKGEAQLLGHSVRKAYGEALYARFKPHIDAALSGEKTFFEDEVHVEGKTRHFQCMYMPDRDADGAVHGFYAMAFDITDRKNSELRLAESEERLRTITDNLPVLIAYIDTRETYRFANATHAEWFGMAPHDMRGKTLRQVFGPQAGGQGGAHIKRCLAGERVRFEMESVIHGETRIVDAICIPDIRDGVVQGAYMMTSDVTAIRLQERQLQLLARQDTLTGLANRRCFEEKLAEAARRARRSGQRMIVMVLDLDRFKQINDTLGHAGGDEVLKEFAHRLKSCVRVTDSVARLAGDEFTIILEGIGKPQEGSLVAEKIVHAMRYPVIMQGQPRLVSTSIGIACSGAGAIDTEVLLKEADEALYLAKAAGRNRFHLKE